MGDIVWIQNYHLLMLPLYITRRIISGQVSTGLFLNIPFPSSEIFRVLHYRDEILKGMLSADHIGFHLFEYARHFLTSCKRVFGLKTQSHKGGRLGVEFNGKHTIVSSHVLGLDIEKVIETVNSSEMLASATKRVMDLIGLNIGSLKGCKVLTGYDTVERVKGITLKLLAFEYLLENYPTWVDEVIMIQIGATK